MSHIPSLPGGSKTTTPAVAKPTPTYVPPSSKHTTKKKTTNSASKPVYWGSSFGGTYTQCHKGHPLVFKIFPPEDSDRNDWSIPEDGLYVHAGGESRGGKWKLFPFDDVVTPDKVCVVGPLGTISDSSWAASSPNGKAQLARQTPFVFPIDFPDFGTPLVSDDFWDNLIEYVSTGGFNTLYVQCMGGHGRTGLMLAMIYGRALQLGYTVKLGSNEKPDYFGFKTAASLIQRIREEYCEKAVEAECQLTYVATLLDLEEGDLSFHKLQTSKVKKGTPGNKKAKASVSWWDMKSGAGTTSVKSEPSAKPVSLPESVTASPTDWVLLSQQAYAKIAFAAPNITNRVYIDPKASGYRELDRLMKEDEGRMPGKSNFYYASVAHFGNLVGYADYLAEYNKIKVTNSSTGWVIHWADDAETVDTIEDVIRAFDNTYK